MKLFDILLYLSVCILQDTGSDGCHTFHIDAVSLAIPQVFEETRYAYYKLHVETSFTEQGTGKIYLFY